MLSPRYSLGINPIHKQFYQSMGAQFIWIIVQLNIVVALKSSMFHMTACPRQKHMFISMIWNTVSLTSHYNITMKQKMERTS